MFRSQGKREKDFLNTLQIFRSFFHSIISLSFLRSFWNSFLPFHASWTHIKCKTFMLWERNIFFLFALGSKSVSRALVNCWFYDQWIYCSHIFILFYFLDFVLRPYYSLLPYLSAYNVISYECLARNSILLTVIKMIISLYLPYFIFIPFSNNRLWYISKI